MTSPIAMFQYLLSPPSLSLYGISTGAGVTTTTTTTVSVFTKNLLEHSPKRRTKTTTVKNALREWREYEEAVKNKDLARALRLLKEKPFEEKPFEEKPFEEKPFEEKPFEEKPFEEKPFEEKPFDPSLSPRSRSGGELGNRVGWDRERERDWEVLDTCLNADDMRLVGAAYSFLKDRGFLPNFGKCRSIVLDGPREVTPGYLKSSTGLEVSKLSPKKWGLSGGSNVALFAILGGTSYLLNQGIDIRPNLAAVLGLAMVDAIFLGGSCLAQITSYWPPHRRRILVHEAGHLLVAYLMGCPIRGVILDPIMAMQMGIQGQAGTQFWDENLQMELAQGRLSGTAFDRYCMVLFGGIAAEALVYGEAEGGENDENLFRGISVLLDPPLSVAEMSNQARWSVLQSYNLLKWHKNAHRAAVKAMQSGGSLSVVIRRIEEALSLSTDDGAI